MVKACSSISYSTFASQVAPSRQGESALGGTPSTEALPIPREAQPICTKQFSCLSPREHKGQCHLEGQPGPVWLVSLGQITKPLRVLKSRNDNTSMYPAFLGGGGGLILPEYLLCPGPHTFCLPTALEVNMNTPTLQSSRRGTYFRSHSQ